MKVQTIRSFDRRRGQAAVELALAATLLLIITIGAADFARLFYDAIAVTNAAAAGSFYGSQRVAFTGRNSEMRTMVEDDAAGIQRGGSLTAETDRYCDCPADPATSPSDSAAVDCIVGTCAGYGQPRVYVRTRVRQAFRTLGPWPGVPDPVDINQLSYFRAQ